MLTILIQGIDEAQVARFNRWTPAVEYFEAVDTCRDVNSADSMDLGVMACAKANEPRRTYPDDLIMRPSMYVIPGPIVQYSVSLTCSTSSV